MFVNRVGGGRNSRKKIYSSPGSVRHFQSGLQRSGLIVEAQLLRATLRE